ncbi:hypothetical protein [Desulfocastanea catecholica]
MVLYNSLATVIGILKDRENLAHERLLKEERLGAMGKSLAAVPMLLKHRLLSSKSVSDFFALCFFGSEYRCNQEVRGEISEIMRGFPPHSRRVQQQVGYTVVLDYLFREIILIKRSLTREELNVRGLLKLRNWSSCEPQFCRCGICRRLSFVAGFSGDCRAC